MGQLLSVDESQRLRQGLHPWDRVTARTVYRGHEAYSSLIEAEKMYVRELEAILERVARRQG